jgi:ferredoxin
MEVVIDTDACECHALCVAAVPEVFELTDDTFVHLLDEHPDDNLRSRVELAVRNCPRQAIRVTD